MSNTPKGRNIPWILIVLSFVFGVWPLGVILIVLRLGLDHANNTKTTTTPKTTTTTRSGSSSWTTSAPIHHYTNDRNRQNAETAATDPNPEAAAPQTTTAIPQMTTPAQETTAAPQTMSAPMYASGRGASAASGTATQTTVQTAAGEKKNGRKKKKSVVALRIVAVVLAILGTMVGMDAVITAISSGFTGEMWSSLFSSLYLLAGGAVSWGVSSFLHTRDREAARYLALIGNRDSMSLTKLSAATSYKIGRVKRDLQRMIDDGLFGDQAYIDMSNLCFMRTPDAKPDGIIQQYDDAYRRTM